MSVEGKERLSMLLLLRLNVDEDMSTIDEVEELGDRWDDGDVCIMHKWGLDYVIEPPSWWAPIMSS